MIFHFAGAETTKLLLEGKELACPHCRKNFDPQRTVRGSIPAFVEITVDDSVTYHCGDCVDRALRDKIMPLRKVEGV